MVAGTTKLRRIECSTSTLTRHDRTTGAHLQLSRTISIQIGNTSGVLAIPSPSRWPNPHTDIVAVHETNVIEILVAIASSDTESELDQSHWRSAAASAPQPATTVAGCAVSGTRSIEIATGPRPETTGPSRRGLQLDRRCWLQGETAFTKHSGTVTG